MSQDAATVRIDAIRSSVQARTAGINEVAPRRALRSGVTVLLDISSVHPVRA
jgi:hypothetical protein